MKDRTKTITIIGMLCAMAYVAVAVCRIPMFAFLSYEPKDVIIVIGGLLYGPLAAFAVSLVVSLAEMVTISSTGPIGMVMNVISSCAFACVAAWAYQKNRSFKGAVAGLLAGVAAMTVVMLLWNYLLTPLYLKTPREAVVQMLIPVFLPFNLIKGGINALLAVLLYRPVVVRLRRSRDDLPL